MEFERLPSGIIFDARQHESCPEPAHSQRAVDERNYYSDFRAAGTQEKTESNRRYLPLLEVTLDVHVVTTTSRTVLTQTFLNHSTVPIQQAKYTFPLYDGSAIVSFRFWVGSDKAFEGEVKPKEAAKAEYQEAVFRQRVAALLEEHTPEVFETSVGNIPARTIVKVEIVYIGELKADLGGDGVLVTIPTSVAHRYGTPPAGYIERTGTSSIPVPAENGLKIQVEVSAPAPIRKLESCTHPISVELGTDGNATQTEDFGNLAGAPGFDPKKARATLSDRTATLGKDFVLLILVADRALWSPRALVEPHPDHPEHLALMVTMAPRDLFTSHLPLDTCKAEIVLVADRSGSMECKMEALKSAIRVLLKRIPQQCTFNICSFGSNHSLLWPRSRSCSQENLDTVYHYISESFRADMGGTELLAALKHAVQQRNLEDDMTTEVIVLTDGEVWNTDQTIDFVRATRTDTNEKVRFFALGIGDSVSHRLVQGIGRQGGGFAEVVAKDTIGGWESRVIRMLTGALTPSRWQCEINLGKGSGTSSPLRCAYAKSVSGETTDTIQRPACVQAPYRIPTFHAFTQNSIYFFLDTQAAPLADSITVQAEASTGQKVTVEIQLDRIEAPAGIPIIHVLAAKALMNDLEIGQSWLHSRTYEAYRKNNTAAFEKAVQQEAESIGKRWSITGKWTSFVAVDKINQLEKTADIYRPERLELSELMRPRGTLPAISTLLDSASSDSSRYNYDHGVLLQCCREVFSPRIMTTSSSSLVVGWSSSLSSLVEGWLSSVSVPSPVGVSLSVDVPSRERERYRDETQSSLHSYSPEGYSASTTSGVPFSNSPTVLNTSVRLGLPLLSASPTSGYNHNPLNTLESLKDFNTVFLIDDTDVPFEASPFKVSSSAALVPRLFGLARKLVPRNGNSGIREQSSAMERSFVRFATFITKYVKNGVDLAFVRTGNKYPQITSAQELIDKFKEEQVSNGYRTTLTTYLGQYLSEYAPRYQNSRRQKCLNLVVLTSNWLYADDFEKIVTHYAKQFNEMSATIHILGIQFVIIHRGGGLEQHFQRVKRLNDKNDVRGIVSSASYNPDTDKDDPDTLLKVLFGAINQLQHTDECRID